MNIDFTGVNFFIGLLIALGVAASLSLFGNVLTLQCKTEFQKTVKISFGIVSQSWVFLIGFYYLDSSLAENMGGQTAKAVFTTLVVVGTLYFLNYLRKVFQ